MSEPPTVISGDCINSAWSRYFLHVMHVPNRKCGAAIISVNCETQYDPQSEVRVELDRVLLSKNLYSSDISAMTIFPQKVWKCNQSLSVKDFCDLCVTKLAPRLKAMNQANRNGLYFERMMSYAGSKKDTPTRTNQLEAIVDRLNGRKKFRVTGLQMSCFDPASDHTAQPQRGFPCLQQVGVDYDGEDGISVTALYPAHNVVDRAYGNLLGLMNLGRFVGHHSGLKLKRLNCYAMSPRLGKVVKRDVQNLVGTVSTYLQSEEKVA
ncbi:hypothetical protein [Rhodopirellula bahusiensis]